MISKTKIKNRTGKKTNPEISETIYLALKTGNKTWIDIAKILSSSTSKYYSINLDRIEEETKAGDTIVIIGKVLSKGEITKKVRICALSFSNAAIEKLKISKSETASLKDEIKKNKKAEGLKVLR